MEAVCLDRVKRCSGWMSGAVESSWGLCTQLFPKQPVVCLAWLTAHTTDLRSYVCWNRRSSPWFNETGNQKSGSTVILCYDLLYNMSIKGRFKEKSKAKQYYLQHCSFQKSWISSSRSRALPTARAPWDCEKQPSLCKSTHFSHDRDGA